MLAMKGGQACACLFSERLLTPVWATFSSQISFTSDSGSKDKTGWNSREINEWSWGLRFCDRFLMIFCWSLWESLCSLNTQGPLLQIFTELSCYFLGIVMVLILGSGKLNTEILPPQKCTKAQETKEKYTSPASCKQNSFPRGFNLKTTSSHRSLTGRIAVLMQEACRNEATVKTFTFFPWHICYLLFKML